MAADAAKGSDDPKKASEGILNQLLNTQQLKEEEFKVGLTKVFFKAGVLAKMEEYRDEKLSTILTGLQSKIRWFIAVRDAKLRNEQRYAKYFNPICFMFQHIYKRK